MSDDVIQMPAPTASWSVLRWVQPVLRYYPVALIFLLWELLTRLQWVDPLLFPPPSAVFHTLYQEVFITHELLVHAGYSLIRALTGWSLAAVCGITIGMLMGRFKAAENFFDPLISAIYPTPKLAIFPLLMVFMGVGDASKIMLIFLGCLFPIVISTYTGVKNVDKYYVWNALTKGARNIDVLLTVILPAALPFIFAGLRVATSTAFLLIVASELIASNEGLGYLIIYAQRTFNPELMLAGVIIVAGLGFTADRLLQALGRKLFAWQERSDV